MLVNKNAQGLHAGTCIMHKQHYKRSFHIQTSQEQHNIYCDSDAGSTVWPCVSQCINNAMTRRDGDSVCWMVDGSTNHIKITPLLTLLRNDTTYITSTSIWIYLPVENIGYSDTSLAWMKKGQGLFFHIEFRTFF